MSEPTHQRKTMKQFAAVALLAAISASASAQSQVTLFGIVDVGARYVKNGDNHVKSLSSNGVNTSRLGFRGVEDLGDALPALDLDQQHPSTPGGQGQRQRGRDGRLAGAALAGDHV